MLAGTTKWQYFTVIDTFGQVLDYWGEIELECHSCGHHFIVDTLTDHNMVFDIDSRSWLPRCPECGKEGKTDFF